MKNPRITRIEQGLLMGAIRRVFSRSDLRRSIVTNCKIEYFDENRPRVRNWGICASCKCETPLYKMEVDHIDPVVPVYSSLDEMTWDDTVNRVWCPAENLQSLCLTCHVEKTKAERGVRAKNKRSKVK